LGFADCAVCGADSTVGELWDNAVDDRRDRNCGDCEIALFFMEANDRAVEYDRIYYRL
jgi:hypothetical protein